MSMVKEMAGLSRHHEEEFHPLQKENFINFIKAEEHKMRNTKDDPDGDNKFMGFVRAKEVCLESVINNIPGVRSRSPSNYLLSNEETTLKAHTYLKNPPRNIDNRLWISRDDSAHLHQEASYSCRSRSPSYHRSYSPLSHRSCSPPSHRSPSPNCTRNMCFIDGRQQYTTWAERTFIKLGQELKERLHFEKDIFQLFRVCCLRAEMDLLWHVRYPLKDHGSRIFHYTLVCNDVCISCAQSEDRETAMVEACKNAYLKLTKPYLKILCDSTGYVEVVSSVCPIFKCPPITLESFDDSFVEERWDLHLDNCPDNNYSNSSCSDHGDENCDSNRRPLNRSFPEPCTFSKGMLEFWNIKPDGKFRDGDEHQFMYSKSENYYREYDQGDDINGDNDYRLSERSHLSMERHYSPNNSQHDQDLKHDDKPNPTEEKFLKLGKDLDKRKHEQDIFIVIDTCCKSAGICLSWQRKTNKDNFYYSLLCDNIIVSSGKSNNKRSAKYKACSNVFKNLARPYLKLVNCDSEYPEIVGSFRSLTEEEAKLRRSSQDLKQSDSENFQSNDSGEMEPWDPTVYSKMSRSQDRGTGTKRKKSTDNPRSKLEEYLTNRVAQLINYERIPLAPSKEIKPAMKSKFIGFVRAQENNSENTSVQSQCNPFPQTLVNQFNPEMWQPSGEYALTFANNQSNMSQLNESIDTDIKTLEMSFLMLGYNLKERKKNEPNKSKLFEELCKEAGLTITWKIKDITKNSIAAFIHSLFCNGVMIGTGAGKEKNQCTTRAFNMAYKQLLQPYLKIVPYLQGSYKLVGANKPFPEGGSTLQGVIMNKEIKNLNEKTKQDPSTIDFTTNEDSIEDVVMEEGSNQNIINEEPIQQFTMFHETADSYSNTKIPIQLYSGMVMDQQRATSEDALQHYPLSQNHVQNLTSSENLQSVNECYYSGDPNQYTFSENPIQTSTVSNESQNLNEYYFTEENRRILQSYLISVGQDSNLTEDEDTYKAAMFLLSSMDATGNAVDIVNAGDHTEIKIKRKSLNMGNMNQLNEFISEENIGSKLLRKMGWEGGGIGKDGNKGIEQPIAVDAVHGHSGLGHDRKSSLSTEFQTIVDNLLKNYAKGDEQKNLVFSTDYSKEERVFIFSMARRHKLKPVTRKDFSIVITRKNKS